jgi:GDP-4-dehydro-6-deoxy-D-mannose reductase
MADVDLLLTGASGFVGRHVLAQAATASLAVQACDWDLLDSDLTAERIAAMRPRSVLHLAAAHRGGDPWAMLAHDLRMSAGLLAALAAHALDAPLLVAGSAAQYGMCAGRPLRETDPTEPVAPYGAVKCVLERAVTATALRGDVRVIWARSFNHIGPGQGDDAPVAQWVRQIADAERAGGGELRTGRLDVVRDFLDVRDVAEAYLALVRAPEAAGVVNVCSGTGTTMRALLDLLIAEAGASVAVEPDPALHRATDPPMVVGDPARLHELTGWRPRVPLRDSVRSVLADTTGG